MFFLAGAAVLAGLPQVAHAQDLAMTASGPLKVGFRTTLTATDAVPGEMVLFLASTETGAGACPAPLGGLCLGLLNAKRIGGAIADANGLAQMKWKVPATLPIDDYHLQAVHAGVTPQVSDTLMQPALWSSLLQHVVDDDASYELATHLYAGSVGFEVGSPAVAELPYFESGSVEVTTGVDLVLPAFEECTQLSIGGTTGARFAGVVHVEAPVLSSCPTISVWNNDDPVTLDLPVLTTALGAVGPAIEIVGAGVDGSVVVDVPLLTAAQSIILLGNAAPVVVDAPTLTAITHPYGGGLSVFDNPGLVEIVGWFPALVTADVVDLSDNDALVSVSSLGSGAVETDGLTVWGNDSLTDVSGLASYSPWFASFIDNPLLPSCDAAAIVELAAFPFPGTCDGNALDECSDGDDPAEICTP